MQASTLLVRWAENPSAAAAITDDRGTHSYESIARHAYGVAAALGDVRGERVALLVPPGAAFVASLLGAWLAGACVVVLSPLHPPPETAYFLDDSKATAIVVSADLRARVEASGVRLLDPAGCVPASSFDSALLAPASAAALQLYTSGTTGKPKGAVLTHANLDANTAVLETAWGMAPSDLLLHVLPLHHTHGLVVALLTTLRAGAHVHMLPAFDARAVWAALEDATVFMAVPTIYSKLVAAFDKALPDTQEKWMYHARTLRLATSGSAALPVSLGNRWRQIAGRLPLERYGMTEIGMALSNPLDHAMRQPGSVGYPLPTVEARVVGGENEGELWVRGPSVFDGYFGKEEATRASFAPSDDGGAPWFMTGDTVLRDPSGSFKILGRSSVDILKSGGYKISALEIEEVIRELEGVAEVAVVGVPDEEWGDRIIAVIVAKPGYAGELDTEKLREFCKQKLAVYKVPKEAILVAELPRNAMGKVVKPDLVKLLTKSL
ncbi:MAG: AMP-binding protein [Polyangiaceae bacterium]